MRSSFTKNKQISDLNLNFLDMKFKSLQRQSISFPSAYKHTRKTILPSLSKIQCEPSLDYASIKGHNNHLSDGVDLEEYIKSISTIKKIDSKKVEKKKQSKKHLSKYKEKIKQIRKQNDQLHKSITKLYYEDDNQNSSIMRIQGGSKSKGTKYVSNLRILTQVQENQNGEKTKGIKQNSKANKYQRLYENLFEDNEHNPNKQQFNNLKKKIMNNNLDKLLESYLLQRKIRIPQFIRKLR